MKYKKAGAFAGIFAVFLVLVLNPASANADQILTFTGLGPVKIGMTLTQMEAALGSKMEPMDPSNGMDTEACWFTARADGIDGAISYLIQNEKVTRIDVDDSLWGRRAETVIPPVETKEGIRIGSSTADVKKVYGSRLIINFHPQGDDGDENYLWISLPSADKEYGLLFEIWEGKVKSLYAGFADIFQADEVCD